MERRKLAMCPSCRCTGEFEFLGEQRWPRDIAALAHLPAVINLWGCPHCHSTISETDLLLLSGAPAPASKPSAHAARQVRTPLAVVVRGRGNSE
ncbi:MAG: hypothetical protein IT323_05720 [Anaerolineae bacterium]|nr:hypothetical protein [Anaerolineae bacterium]